MVWSERRRLLVALAGAAAVFVVWLVYAPARSGVLVGEDHTLVRRDTRWQEAPLTALFTQALWPESQRSELRVRHYRPATLATYRLDHALGGSARELHFTNVFLHVIACALLALVAARLGARGGAAIVAALAWALAPRLSESVAWISGRPDVLAGTLGLAALALSPDVTDRVPPSRAWVRGIASAAFLFLALASNDTALAFAVALAASAVVRRPGELRVPRERIVRAAACTVGPLVAFVGLRAHALADASREVSRTLPETDLLSHLLAALEALGRYAEMTIVPTDARTSIGAQGVLDVPHVVAGAAVVGALVIGARRGGRRLGVAGSACGALAIAALGIALARGTQGAAGVASDRLLYVPLAGLAIGAAVAARRLGPAASRVAGCVAFAGVILLGATTKARAEDYTDEIGFWVEAAERAHPANPYARSSLASVVIDHGRTELGCRLIDVASRIHEAHGRAGSVSHRRAREAQATCLSRLGHFDEASRTFEGLVRDNPENGRLHMGLGYVRLHQLDFDAAELELARAVQLDPVLGPTVKKTMKELVQSRTDAPSFDTEEERRANRGGYASFLASAGRLGDAVREMEAIAEDDAEAIGTRKLAVRFLVKYGDVAVARRAGRSTYGAELASVDEETLRHRERLLAEIAVHEARIERLAGPPSAIAAR